MKESRDDYNLIAMKISVVIEGLFSFLLSPLLKLGGSFEISRGHLATPVLGCTVAPEGRGKPLCCLDFPAWPW